MSIFDSSGLYIRTPGGNIEDVGNMYEAGFRWIALNVSDHEDEEWDTVKQRASAIGMTCLPWRYVRSEFDIIELCTLASVRYAGRVIINAERELWDRRISLEQIKKYASDLDVALSVEPIPHSGLPWYTVKEMKIHCGLFPQETLPETYDPRYCRALYFAYGMEKVDFMYGNHDLTPQQFPPHQKGRSVYTADDAKDLGQNYQIWGPQNYAPLVLPYTGPYYHTTSGKSPTKGLTVKALKIAMHNAGFGTFYAPDQHYNQALKAAMIRFQRWAGITPLSGNYGLGSANALLSLLSAIPGQTYALNREACNLILQDDDIRS